MTKENKGEIVLLLSREESCQQAKAGKWKL